MNTIIQKNRYLALSYLMVTPWCKEGNLKFLSNFGASNDTGVSSDECPLVFTLNLED